VYIIVLQYRLMSKYIIIQNYSKLSDALPLEPYLGHLILRFLSHVATSFGVMLKIVFTLHRHQQQQKS